MSTVGVVALFVAATLLQVALTLVATRTVVRSNDQLMERIHSMRAETLESMRGAQAEAHQRYVAETRAATAKMNAMADALWNGLSGTVGESE